MATVYPGAIDSAPTTHQDAQDAYLAIEGTLGSNPHGAFTTVKDRLAAAGARVPRPSWNDYLAWSMPPGWARDRSAPTAQQMWAVGVPAYDGMVVTSVTYIVGLGGSGYVANQCFIGLYDTAGTLLRGTADLSAAFGATGSVNTVALTSTLTLSGLTDDRVWVAFLINASTMPQLAGVVSQSSAGNSGFAGRNGSTTFTSLPATATFPTNITPTFFAGLK